MTSPKDTRHAIAVATQAIYPSQTTLHDRLAHAGLSTACDLWFTPDLEPVPIIHAFGLSDSILEQIQVQDGKATYTGPHPTEVHQYLQERDGFLPALHRRWQQWTQLGLMSISLDIKIETHLIAYLATVQVIPTATRVEFTLKEEHRQCLADLIHAVPDDIVMPFLYRSYHVLFLRHLGWATQSKRALQTLMLAESHAPEMTPDSPFLFDAFVDPGIHEEYIHPDRVRACLRTFVGPYLEELDLSRTAIIGSALEAACLYLEKEKLSDDDRIASLFPPVRTTFHDADAIAEIRTAIGQSPLLSIYIESVDRGTVSLNEKTYPFDIATDNPLVLLIDASAEEFPTIAHAHYQTMLRHYPEIRLVEHENTYQVVTTDPAIRSTFRSVILQRGWTSVVTTEYFRAAYTSRWTPEPHLYLCASAVLMTNHRRTRTMPTESDGIWRVYRSGQRLPENQSRIHCPGIKLSTAPILKGKLVPASIFALQVEYPKFIKKIQKAEAQRQRYIPNPAQVQLDRERLASRARIPPSLPESSDDVDLIDPKMLAAFGLHI